jgi:hypothetical protein
MMCSSCSKLALLYVSNKQCMRCQGAVVVNMAVICEVCSATDKICTVCLKKLTPLQPKPGGCNCGKK